METVLSLAHRYLSEVIQPGDVAVDATVGNGHDTVHLAQCVGPAGCVIGFDIQHQALENTRNRLSDAGCDGQIELFLESHEFISDTVLQVLSHRKESPQSQLAAVCYNLGYLPGGDKSIVTQTASTLGSLKASLDLLRSDGVLTVVLYPGHDGGREERDAVLEWASVLPTDTFRVMHHHTPNRRNAPELLAMHVIAA